MHSLVGESHVFLPECVLPSVNRHRKVYGEPIDRPCDSCTLPCDSVRPPSLSDLLHPVGHCHRRALPPMIYSFLDWPSSVQYDMPPTEANDVRPTLQRLTSRDVVPVEADTLAHSVKRERLLREHVDRESRGHRMVAPPLAPKVLAPLHHSKASDATHRLHRIEGIQISRATQKEDGNTYYAIDVYMQHNDSHIPTNQARHRRVLHSRQQEHDHHHHSKPDFTVERRFSEFDKLRLEMLEMVEHMHHHYCSFCEGYMILLLFSMSQPMTLTKAFVHSKASRARLLTKFTRNIVDEFQINRPRCRFPCHASGLLPTVLHDFLFRSDESIQS